jgi:hypothetical protein
MNRCRPISSSGATASIMACLCLVLAWSSDRPTVPSNGPSDHPTLLSSLILLFNLSDATRKWTVGSFDSVVVFTQCTNSSNHCTNACCLGTVGSSDSVLSFPFLSHFLPLNLAGGILASLGPRNVYKDMLNNVASPIDHVVMNHQNQTRTNVIWGHVCYNVSLFGDL